MLLVDLIRNRLAALIDPCGSITRKLREAPFPLQSCCGRQVWGGGQASGNAGVCFFFPDLGLGGQRRSKNADLGSYAERRGAAKNQT